MSIDWLNDLERGIENGRTMYGCPSTVGRNQWVINADQSEVEKVAKRTAEHRKIAVNVIQVVAKYEAIAGDMFLVPTQIGEAGPRGEPQIQWSVVETREAAEMMRDVRHGPSPFFGMRTITTIEPPESE